MTFRQVYTDGRTLTCSQRANVAWVFCSILLHSLTDFNLQIPSNAMLFFTFVGISLAANHANSAN